MTVKAWATACAPVKPLFRIARPVRDSLITPLALLAVRYLEESTSGFSSTSSRPTTLLSAHRGHEVDRASQINNQPGSGSTVHGVNVGSITSMSKEMNKYSGPSLAPFWLTDSQRVNPFCWIHDPICLKILKGIVNFTLVWQTEQYEKAKLQFSTSQVSLRNDGPYRGALPAIQLSFREVKEILAEGRLIVDYRTHRQWC